MLHKAMEEKLNIVNINVGVLGHVDSGKTSLVKSLSTHLSTAALDKNPQSQQRGITLDLGFSAFTVEVPERLKTPDQFFTHLQFTLVDCPGHASLIRTIIGGAQIIDLMILVVDAVKGMQMQTGECIVIGEMTTDKMVVVLNKVDLIPEVEREASIQLMKKRVQNALKNTIFSGCPIVSAAASVGGEKTAAAGALKENSRKYSPTPESGQKVKDKIEAERCWGIANLMQVLQETVELPHRSSEGPLLFSIDHCFSIKGQGSVLTGTVLSGSMNINDTIELPQLGLERRIKSMQSFHRPVRSVQKGDRVGVCVTNLDPKQVERSLACTPGTVVKMTNALALVRGIKFFKPRCHSWGLIHITVGHQTVMARALFFGAAEFGALQSNDCSPAICNPSKQGESASLSKHNSSIPDMSFSWTQEFAFQPELMKEQMLINCPSSSDLCPLQWCLLQFQAPIYCCSKSLVIGSRFDMAENMGCRIAFFGKIVQPVKDEEIRNLLVFMSKEKKGVVDRIHNETEIIGKNMFGKNTDLNVFIGMWVQTEQGHRGKIVGTFGKSGKFKVRFSKPVKITPGSKFSLSLKKYVFDHSKAMQQNFGLKEDVSLKGEYHDHISLPTEVSQISNAEIARISLSEDFEDGKVAQATSADQLCSPKSEAMSNSIKLSSKVEISKLREGVVEKMKGEPNPDGSYDTIIVSGLFTAEENIRDFTGYGVLADLKDGTKHGVLAGPFGIAGKCKVTFNGGITITLGSTVWLLSSESNQKQSI